MFKKGIFLFILIVAAVQVHAERRFVLVDIYHLTEKNFITTDKSPDYDYDLAKPHCEAGGIPEIDEGAFHIFPFDTRYRVNLGEVIDFDNFWRLHYRGSGSDRLKLIAKVYCSYPIQCIKQ